MHFLDELRQVVQAPPRPLPADVDVGHYRRLALGELDASERPLWLETRLSGWIQRELEPQLSRAVNQLSADLGFDPASPDMRRALEEGVRATVRQQAVHNVAASVAYVLGQSFHCHGKRRSPDPLRYAIEVGLLHRESDRVRRSRTGSVFVGLTGRDAVRWLLALEVEQSLGMDDRWRASGSLLSWLLRAGALVIDYETAAPWDRFLNDAAMLRLQSFGIVEEVPGFGYCQIDLSPLGRELVSEVLDDPPPPFVLLARSLLADASTFRWTGAQGVGAAKDREIARAVAHEVRNAVVPLRITAESVLERLEPHVPAAEVERFRRRLLEGADGLLRYVEQLVLVAERGVVRERVELEGVLREVEATLRPELNGRARVSLALTPGLRLLADPSQLRLALVNLVRNAGQQGRDADPVTVRITTETTGSHVVILVDDSGPGVPAGDRARVLTPGYSTRGTGSGHGLAIARDIIERELGGVLSCEDSPLGGARFRTELPMGTSDD